MPPTGLLLVISAVSLAFALWGSIMVVYPKLAFKLENILQLRSAELSFLGLIMHKSAGVLLIAVMLLIPLSYGLVIPTIAGLLGAAIPPVYYKRTRGVFVVQGLDGEVTGPDTSRLV
ncbi:MAG: hypothetical protein ACLFM8_00425 [Halobacteriales archaeon]